MTAPARDALGRPLNPDTNLPYPTASQAQLELADGILARMLDEHPLLAGDDTRLIRDALVEAVVRQHGRTLRAIRAELNGHADADMDRARSHADAAVSTADGVVLDDLRAAARYAERARTLHGLILRGDRS